MNDLGFTEEYLKNYMKENVFNWFIQWMRGKTISQVDGENTYYYWDVYDFCEFSGYKYPV